MFKVVCVKDCCVGFSKYQVGDMININETQFLKEHWVSLGKMYSKENFVSIREYNLKLIL